MRTRMMKTLLVEDDRKNPELFRKIFAAGGGQGTGLPGGVLLAALRKLSEEDVDLILLDMVLPDNFTFPTLTRILPIHPDAPLIVLTGSKKNGGAAFGMEFEPVDFFSKPLNVGHLKTVIQGILARRAPAAVDRGGGKPSSWRKTTAVAQKRNAFPAHE